MKILRPNVPCQVKRRIGRDLHGNPKYGLFQPTTCSVLNLTVAVKGTPVGSSYTGSQGRSQESIANAHLLFRPDERIAIDDVIALAGATFEVFAVRHRYDVFGVLDHLEVEATIE